MLKRIIGKTTVILLVVNSLFFETAMTAIGDDDTPHDTEVSSENIESLDLLFDEDGVALSEPFNACAISEAGVYVNVFAEAGVLPTGTTMHLKDVSLATAEMVASEVLEDNIYSAAGVDISFYNADGVEIEPDGYVLVSMSLANPLDGEEFVLIHVSDSGETESLGEATANGASFASDEFSLYVLAGVGTEQDPISNVYREYTIGYGESVTILSDEKNYDGAWIPGEGDRAWSVVDISGGSVDLLADIESVRGDADVQPRLTINAKNKTGTLRVAFRYTHPEDRTHKTVTGEFIATHYYLIHIIDKSIDTFSVVFRNNDGTGISHVGEADLDYTIEEGVTATRSVSSNYTHTFTISADRSTRAGKVTLIMPEYPGNTTRTSGGKTYNFIGWSTSSSANPTAASNGLTPIVYPYPDAHVFSPGDKFPLDRDVTLWAVWATQNSLTATFFIRIDDHIPNEPQSHGNASYTQIGKDIVYTLPSAQFKKDAVYGVDQGWDPSKRQKPWPAKVFSDLKAAGKLPDDVTNVQEFNARYRIVWSTIKRENEGLHVDGILYEKSLYNLAYHENGDLVVVSSMSEGVKDIPAGETTLIDTRIPNRYDMVFTGWNTKSDGSGIWYIPGSSVVVSEHPELDTDINTLHLYAQWVKASQYTYTVRFLEAGTNRVLKSPIVYGDQIAGNKVYSKAESEKASSEIEDYVFSYANPAIGSGDGCIIIGEDNSKNVITLYYMPIAEEIGATALFLKKTNETGELLSGAKFELTDHLNSSKILFTSDKEGVVQIPFTKDPGPNADDILNYTLVEKEAPEGYIKSEDIYIIQIKRGTPHVVHFSDENSKTVYPLVATVFKNDDEVDSSDITIVNETIPDPVNFSINATKLLEGRTLKENEFVFELMDDQGSFIAEVLNAEDGSIVFDNIQAKEAGTYVYEIHEISGEDTEIVYDQSSYTITVTVILGDDKKLAVSSMTYEKDGEDTDSVIFINKYEQELLTITYDLNGGVYNGSSDNILEQYPYGTNILIHEAPTREGYKFLYWKGSEYQPNDEYLVVEDHTFTAIWELIPQETPEDKGNIPTGPDAGKDKPIPQTRDYSNINIYSISFFVSMMISILLIIWKINDYKLN